MLFNNLNDYEINELQKIKAVHYSDFFSLTSQQIRNLYIKCPVDDGTSPVIVYCLVQADSVDKRFSTGVVPAPRGHSEDDGVHWKQYCGKGGIEVPLGGICFKASLHQRFTTIQVYTLNYLQKTVVCNIKTCQFTPLRLDETVDPNSCSL